MFFYFLTDFEMQDFNADVVSFFEQFSYLEKTYFTNNKYSYFQFFK